MEETWMRLCQDVEAAERREIDDGPMQVDEGLVDGEELVDDLLVQIAQRAVGDLTTISRCPCRMVLIVNNFPQLLPAWRCWDVLGGGR